MGGVCGRDVLSKVVFFKAFKRGNLDLCKIYEITELIFRLKVFNSLCSLQGNNVLNL